MPLTEKKIITIEYGHTCEGGTKPNPNVVFNKSAYHWKFFSYRITHCPNCGELLETISKPDRPARKKS